LIFILGGNRKVIFRDSMLHMTGALAVLIYERFKNRTDKVMKKAHFPHLFNKAKNYNYVGKIPDLKYYDLGFTLKNDKAKDEFYKWYHSWDGRDDWCFEKELLEYCVNDVEMLVEIVKQHHYYQIKMFEKIPYLMISPWHFPTAPGYCHKLSIIDKTWGFGLVESGLEITELVQRAATAAMKGWCKLTHIEYYFMRLFLRGGRTENFYTWYQGRCAYVDFQSMYPFIQVVRSLVICGQTVNLLYPVGPPNIEIFDRDYYPCDKHVMNPQEICECTFHDKRSRNCYPYLKLKTQLMDIQPDGYLKYLSTFGQEHVGVLMVDFTPPTDLKIAVIPTFQKTGEKGFQKCVWSLLPTKKAFVPSPLLQLAVRKGYKIDKIYRVDRYKGESSPWAAILKLLYVAKLTNSMKAPECPLECKRISESYRRKFGMEIDFTDWDDNPGLKAAAKVLLNGMWGKHAESVDHQQTFVMNNDDNQDNWNFCQNVMSDLYSDISFDSLGNFTMFKFKENRSFVKPTLMNGYLPVAVFVPCYGQMYLYNYMDQLGDRLLYVDTDSLIYKLDGGSRLETGDIWGDLEIESEDIVEFVALGPKTYGLKYSDGTKMFKCKGVSLKRAHLNIINFDKAVELVKNRDSDPIKVPQMNFVGGVGHGLETENSDKIIRFDQWELKGDYDRSNYRIRPFGWDHCSDLN